jgi:hypothetical protein
MSIISWQIKLPSRPTKMKKKNLNFTRIFFCSQEQDNYTKNISSNSY